MNEFIQSKIQNPKSKIIFLVGFMGSGKTTLGRLLADHLGRRFIDLDEWIVEYVGKPITQIFADDGEAAFRRLESKLLCEVVKESNVVISLGGGAFVSETNQRLVKDHGIAIWLDCSFDVLLKRLEDTADRPLNRSPEQLRELWQGRLPSYSQADLRIDTTTAEPQILLTKIVRLLIPDGTQTPTNGSGHR